MFVLEFCTSDKPLWHYTLYIINKNSYGGADTLKLQRKEMLFPVQGKRYCPHIRRKSLQGMRYTRMRKISRQVTCCYKPFWKHLFRNHWTNNKQKYFIYSDEFSVIQCRTLSQHPQYTVKVHSLHYSNGDTGTTANSENTELFPCHANVITLQ
jgi:hypothetical protein